MIAWNISSLYHFEIFYKQSVKNNRSVNFFFQRQRLEIGQPPTSTFKREQIKEGVRKIMHQPGLEAANCLSAGQLIEETVGNYLTESQAQLFFFFNFKGNNFKKLLEFSVIFKDKRIFFFFTVNGCFIISIDSRSKIRDCNILQNSLRNFFIQL